MVTLLQPFWEKDATALLHNHLLERARGILSLADPFREPQDRLVNVYRFWYIQ